MRDAIVPSYSYPGIHTIRLVLGAARGKTAREICNELRIKEWKVRAALSGLKAMELVETSRKGRKITYKARGTVEDLISSYSRTFHVYLASILPGKTLDWMAVNFWPEEKETTRRKRATYFIKLGRDLGAISSSGDVYGLTAEGVKSIFPHVLLDAYVTEAKGKMGEYVSLTRILDRLEVLGIERELAKELMVDSVSVVGGRLSSSPALSEEVLEDGIFSGSKGYLYYLIIERGDESGLR